MNIHLNIARARRGGGGEAVPSGHWRRRIAAAFAMAAASAVQTSPAAGVAKIGSTEYPTFAAAVAAANATVNARVELTANITEDLTFSGAVFDKTATLDLKGFSIKNTANFWTVLSTVCATNEAATLTIVDSVGGGKILPGKDGVSVGSVEKGTVCIEGGTLEGRFESAAPVPGVFAEGRGVVKGGRFFTSSDPADRLRVNEPWKLCPYLAAGHILKLSGSYYEAMTDEGREILSGETVWLPSSYTQEQADAAAAKFALKIGDDAAAAAGQSLTALRKAAVKRDNLWVVEVHIDRAQVDPEIPLREICKPENFAKLQATQSDHDSAEIELTVGVHVTAGFYYSLGAMSELNGPVTEGPRVLAAGEKIPLQARLPPDVTDKCFFKVLVHTTAK